MNLRYIFFSGSLRTKKNAQPIIVCSPNAMIRCLTRLVIVLTQAFPEFMHFYVNTV